VICTQNICRSGRKECTRPECGYLDEHDARALRLNAAMNHSVRGDFWPREAADLPKPRP
jgi:hypothetical protein